MALATGHYIRKRQGAHGPELLRSIDGDRDQSYFLFATTRSQLDYLAFPIGGDELHEVGIVDQGGIVRDVSEVDGAAPFRVEHHVV